MTKPEAQQTLDANLKEIQRLVFQMNELNSREVLGKVYFCLEAIKVLLND